MPLKRVRIGSRTDNRVFNFNGDWSPNEIDQISIRLREVFEACGGWNPVSNAIADSLKKKRNPVPIPDVSLADQLPPSEKLTDKPVSKEWMTIETFNRTPDWWEGKLRKNLPRINWATLGQSGIDPDVLKELRDLRMGSLQQSADVVASIDNKPATVAKPIKGTLHEAMRKYAEYVKADQPANYDRHAKIRQLIERSDDVPLATFDITQCRTLIDYWRNRPPRKDGKGNYSAKRSREQLAELDLFFKHTHTSDDFKWRMPDDLQLLKRSISKDEKKSLSFITIKLFTIEELRSLVSIGTLIQRLISTWCLNCSHGAAEIGRVTWGDLYLNQDHPWKSQGLQVDAGGDWIGFLRKKTDVVGWWRLWPETVKLIGEWKTESEKILKRKISDSDRLIITQSGEPMYKEASKNAQSKFAKEFGDHRVAANVRKLPFGTLRNQLSDWISTTQGDAVAASVALAHGIPHREDKLLFAHYANRPWKKLFEHQMAYRREIFKK